MTRSRIVSALVIVAVALGAGSAAHAVLLGGSGDFSPPFPRVTSASTASRYSSRSCRRSSAQRRSSRSSSAELTRSGSQPFWRSR